MANAEVIRTKNGLIHVAGNPIQTPLKIIRARRGLKQYEVAEAVNIKTSHYCRIENGCQASPAVARRIALFFGREVTEDQIFYPEDYVRVEEPKLN